MKRAPQNSSVLVARFQSGGGLLNHAGGTYSHSGMIDYSHSGMIDYTRIPISELHLGKFPDSMEFQSWKVNIKPELCSKSADPDLRMLWSKEIEIAKSIGELMTSQSIVVRTHFPDYDMLDAMIASALKLLDNHFHFRKRVSVEEQRAQKYEGGKLLT